MGHMMLTMLFSYIFIQNIYVIFQIESKYKQLSLAKGSRGPIIKVILVKTQD